MLRLDKISENLTPTGTTIPPVGVLANIPDVTPPDIADPIAITKIVLRVTVIVVARPA